MHAFHNRYQNSNYQAADTAHGARVLIAHIPKGDSEPALSELLEVHRLRKDGLSWDEIAATSTVPVHQLKSSYWAAQREQLL